MQSGRLSGMRCYLIGAMDRVKDSGTGWREYITPFLRERSVVVLNPCDKPISVGHESTEDRKRRHRLKYNRRWAQLQREIRLLRVVDLRLVDMSDFLICNLDTSIHACGTYEELFWANRLKRPILIHCEQGKQGLPDWLFGVFPHQFFFDSWCQLKNYLKRIHTSKSLNHYKRWMFFDYWRLTPEGQESYFDSKGCDKCPT